MQHTSTITVPEHTREIVEYSTCDLCGTHIQRHGFTEETVDIIYDYYAPASLVVDARHEKIIIDMCPTCFKTAFLSWLEEKYNFVPKRINIPTC